MRTIIYAYKSLIIVLPRTLSIFEPTNIWEKRVIKSYLCKLFCVAKAEIMSSTDSAFDEIVSSFLHEFLSVKR